MESIKPTIEVLGGRCVEIDANTVIRVDRKSFGHMISIVSDDGHYQRLAGPIVDVNATMGFIGNLGYLIARAIDQGTSISQEKIQSTVIKAIGRADGDAKILAALDNDGMAELHMAPDATEVYDDL